MAYEIISDVKMPYLRAIQAVPGDTASEKLSWIGRAAWTVGFPEQIPEPLEPLIKVETALRQKKHEDLVDCITSEDATVINRVFKANWFFDHSNINIGIECFCEQIIPLVSLKTRTRIINKLADNLTDTAIAEPLFDKLEPEYGVYNVCPLLAACDDSFAFHVINNWKLALPIKIAKKIFRKKPDLMIRYFKLLKPTKPNERASFPIDMKQYAFFLPKLVKNRVHDFAELFEMYEDHPLQITLSNTCAEIFLKKGLQYLIKKPRLYIDILPLKKISVEILETIFLGLLPTKISNYDTNKLLKYLEYYPQSKRYELLRVSYLKKYNAELLDETKNVTPNLLRILPEKERIKQARIKIEKESSIELSYYDLMNYEKIWICYLPIDEAITNIKEKINKTAAPDGRLNFINQMIYACKVNERIKDNDASANEKDLSAGESDASTNETDSLAEFFKYFIVRHKNEDSWFFEQTMRQVLRWYDVPHLSNERQNLLFDIIKLFYVKFGHIPAEIAEAVIHFRLINNMPIDELIYMLIGKSKTQHTINFNLLMKYPQYEKKCLVTFAKHIEEKYDIIRNKQGEDSIKREKSMLCGFVVAMYNFNDRCDKSKTKIERLTIKDYPWLLDAVRTLIQSQESFNWDMQIVLKRKELEFMMESNKRIADVTTGAALALLKQNYQDILDNWEDYLTGCRDNCCDKTTQRFVKATRWYKDIPIRFVERSMDYLKEKHKDNEDILSTLTILALLLHGETLTNLLIPLIPKKSTIDVNEPEASANYKIVTYIPTCMRLSNPPISVSLIYKLCEGDYLSIALGALRNLSRRYGLNKARTLAYKLTNMRVSAQKHGIRLIYQLLPGRALWFLRDFWNNQTHHSIHAVVFELMQKIMHLTPIVDYVELHYYMINTMQLKDERLLLQLKLPVLLPNKRVSDYFDMWLKAINRLKLAGLDIQKTNKHIINVLQKMAAPPVWNLISEKLAVEIMQKYLFDVNADLSNAARCFSISYLFGEDKIKVKEHSKILIETISSVVTTQWNKGHSKKSRFFLYNNAIHLFIQDFVVNYVNEFYFVNKSTDMQLIDDMLGLFSSVLSPTQAPTSYLLLIYAKKLQECTLSNKGFGWQIDRYMPELVKIFSSSLVQFMANVLKHFLQLTFRNHIDMEEFKLSLMENLIKSDNRDAWLIAVTILSPVTLKSLVTRYDELIKKFREIKDPAVSSVLHDYLNVTDFDSIMFN